MNSSTLNRLIIAVTVAILLLTGCGPGQDPEAALNAMTSEIAEKFGDVPQISTSDLAAWLATADRAAPIILDAREPAEYAVSHLAGAIRVPPGATVAKVAALIDVSRPIVVYCSVGYRSSALARRLAAGGVKEVANLEGSIFKWANEGRPLVRDGGATRAVHPYDDSYGRMLLEQYRSYQ